MTRYDIGVSLGGDELRDLRQGDEPARRGRQDQAAEVVGRFLDLGLVGLDDDVDLLGPGRELDPRRRFALETGELAPHGRQTDVEMAQGGLVEEKVDRGLLVGDADLAVLDGLQVVQIVLDVLGHGAEEFEVRAADDDLLLGRPDPEEPGQGDRSAPAPGPASAAPPSRAGAPARNWAF